MATTFGPAGDLDMAKLLCGITVAPILRLVAMYQPVPVGTARVTHGTEPRYRNRGPDAC